MNLIECSTYYTTNIEEYIFTELSKKFKTGLNLKELLIICSWKSPRRIELVYNHFNNIANNKNEEIDTVVIEFTKKLYNSSSDEERFNMLKIGGIGLATASAIRPVLDDKKYTIYDYRVCESLEKFDNLKDKDKDKISWQDYKDYIDAVIAIKEENNINSLRETDKSLWGKSYIKGIEKIINGIKQ